jgi:putative DNA primase/helicase
LSPKLKPISLTKEDKATQIGAKRYDHYYLYHNNGFALLPVNFKDKIPAISNWQNRRPEDFDPAEFEGDRNVGVVLGTNSGGLVDIDLDCPEALKIAPIFLPPTGFRFGRKSKPESHHFYRCT